MALHRGLGKSCCHSLQLEQNKILEKNTCSHTCKHLLFYQKEENCSLPFRQHCKCIKEHLVSIFKLLCSWLNQCYTNNTGNSFPKCFTSPCNVECQLYNPPNFQDNIVKGTESYSYIFQMRKLKPRREINLTKVEASYPVLKPKSLSSGTSKFLRTPKKEHPRGAVFILQQQY